MKTLLLLACAALAWSQNAPANADPVVLTIGAEKITKSQFETIITSLPDQQQAQVQSPQGKRRLAEQLAEMKTLAQEARARKMDQTDAMKARMALQMDQVLAGAVYQELVNGPADADALRAYYNEHKQEYEEVHARHILIRFQGSRVPVRAGQKDLTDEEALAKVKDLRVKILAGAKFADLAKAESDDTGTGDQGGDLGAFGRGNMVPEFEEAAFKQPVGEVGEPVKSQFGYHLIVVDSRGAKSFDDARYELEQKIKPDLGQKGIDALKKKTPVTFDESYFGK